MTNKFLAVVVLIILSATTLCYANHSAVIITGDTPNSKSTSGVHTWTNHANDNTTETITAISYNYIEFWTDTYLMWELLYKNKSWPTDQIYVLYGNGLDYNTSNERYQASHNNQIKITDYSANVADVGNIFTSLTNGNAAQGIPQMTNADFLFCYTFGHGDQVSGTDVLIALMDGTMTDATFAGYANPVPCWSRVFWMQQCRSGGFVDNLKSEKTVLANVWHGNCFNII